MQDLKKMKKRAIQAELRKESKTFDGWLKYEITVQNPDGSTELHPAYGRDLQDALSRVVHDEKVEIIKAKTKRIPDIFWIVLWFGYVLGWSVLTYELSSGDDYEGLFFLSGLVMITVPIILVKNWFRRRNISK